MMEQYRNLGCGQYSVYIQTQHPDSLIGHILGAHCSFCYGVHFRAFDADGSELTDDDDWAETLYDALVRVIASRLSRLMATSNQLATAC